MRKGRILLSICILINSFDTLAGGWVQSKGNGYFQLSQRFMQADQLFADWSEVVDYRTINHFATSFYGEYGITDKVTTVIDFPFFVSNSISANEFNGVEIEKAHSVNSIGDIDLGVKYGLITEGSFVLNAGLFLGIPIGYTDKDATTPIPTGDGEFNQMLKLEGGYGLSSSVYLVGGFGYNNRTNGYSDDIRYDLEIGYAKKFLFRIKMSGMRSTMNGNDDFTASGFYSNNAEHFTYNPELGYIHDDKFGAAIGVAGGNGRYVHAAPYFTLSLFYKVQ